MTGDDADDSDDAAPAADDDDDDLPQEQNFSSIFVEDVWS